ncbi:hypothetical protein Ae717Ps2_6633c [Pseudonocardia sp. Ae717_Ps2]|uniref:hypothetical protein n=1 Tax=Pseudonocardia sp. Ae717_Ps2 TaxID=1885573 RepID=UPI00094AB516|nr:hypothetical protein [Pseudonocardia sp. Ae717_Ps2]OLM28294.1 hypothetical protein Ae717Ps2_6633c [Pseudonocardia sp. Ae717_Ps2]
MATRWGPWQLTNNGDALTLDPSGATLAHDWIDLTRCTTAAETLDAIVHASRHAPDGGERDDAYIAGLVRAIDDMLDPMANLCSGGQPKTLSPRRLRSILDDGGAR